MPTPRQQFRAVILLVAMLLLGWLCTTAYGGRRGASCSSGGCSVALTPVRKETPQVQRPTVRSHKHVQRYRRGKLKVWRVWRVPRRFRRPLFGGLAPH